MSASSGLAAAAVRAPEDILEDVRGCITSICNVASIVRLRAPPEGEHTQLVDAAIDHLLRLGAEIRDLSWEQRRLDTGDR